MARLRLSRSGPWIGVVGMVCLLWLDVASLLFAPWWGVLLMLGGWLLSLVLLLGWIRPQPRRSAFAPLAGLVVWGLVVWAGIGWWDWTA